MINLKFRKDDKFDNIFIFEIDDTYTVAADNIEDAKRWLCERIENEIDAFVVKRLELCCGDDDIIDLDVEAGPSNLFGYTFKR